MRNESASVIVKLPHKTVRRRQSFLMNTITQDMKYRHSLVSFSLKYGVSKASRKYNRSRSYIYFWLKRYDGSIDSLACQSKRPHSHPNQHSAEEIKLIKDMRRRSPNLGLVEFWFRLINRGYSRHIVSLYRVLKRMELIQKPQKNHIYQNLILK